ncbi:hypothetical protein ACIQNU_01625 [Streptomyces sp. NPDC091292]|uniref:hypothetical protein n=1 Tax=Streptomyces sp. NPDC091292 TaxID=3365991 RepID=UPI003826E087
MDPVVVGAAVTVLVSGVSGLVKIAHRWLSTEVELARIADAGVTERVRCAAPWGSLDESVRGRRVRVDRAGDPSGGGCGGGCGQV